MSLAAGIVLLTLSSRAQLTTDDFARGDFNGDGGFDISDPIYLLFALYVSGAPQQSCDDACDANDDDNVDIGDAIYVLNFLKSPGAPPPPLSRWRPAWLTFPPAGFGRRRPDSPPN